MIELNLSHRNIGENNKFHSFSGRSQGLHALAERGERPSVGGRYLSSLTS